VFFEDNAKPNKCSGSSFVFGFFRLNDRRISIVVQGLPDSGTNVITFFDDGEIRLFSRRNHRELKIKARVPKMFADPGGTFCRVGYAYDAGV